MTNRKFTTTTEYVPSQEREYPAPQQIYVLSGVGAIIIIVNCIFAAIIIFALARNAQSAVPAIIGGVLFYGTATPLMLFIVTGGFAQWMLGREHEVTIRSRDRHEVAMWHAEMSMRVMPPTQLPDSQPTESLQPAALIESPNYVSATPNDRQLARNAKAWAATALYLENGDPNPDAVNLKGGTEAAGRLKTAAPSNPEVKQFLLDRKVLLRVRQGMALNLEQYPNRESLRWLTR